MIRTISGGDRGDCGAGGTSFAIEAAADPLLMKLFPHGGIDARQAAVCAEWVVGTVMTGAEGVAWEPLSGCGSSAQRAG